jgi:hypothetical protein
MGQLTRTVLLKLWHRKELTRAASRSEGSRTKTVASVGEPVVEESFVAAPRRR